MGYMVGVLFQSFACRDPTFTIPFVEETVLSSGRDFSSFVKDQMVADGYINLYDLQFHGSECLFSQLSL